MFNHRALLISSLIPAVLLIGCDRAPFDPRESPELADCGGVQGTLHQGTIDSESWSGPAPHIIRDSIVVRGTLSIAPGTKVCGDSAARILIATTGALVAIGTASGPIIFTALDPAKPWGGIINLPDECEFPPCAPPPLRGRIRHALVEYAHNGVMGLYVDSSRFRQIRCVAVLTRYLTHTVVDTAGINGCAAVVMGSGWGGTDTFVGNIVRGSGGHGLIFITHSLLTSARSADSIILRDSRIENSAGIGLGFSQKYFRNHIIEGSPIRIVGSGSGAVEAPLGTLLALWPTRSAQDSLLGNGNDTLVVWGDAASGEVVVRDDLHWRITSNFLIPWYVFSSGVTIRIEPGGTLVQGTEIRVDGSFIVQGTPDRRANIIGTGRILCRAAANCPAISYATLKNVDLLTGASARLDHVLADQSTIWLGHNSEITHSVLLNGGPGLATLMLSDNTRVESTIIRNARFDGVRISGSDVLLANCEVSRSGQNGVHVINGSAAPSERVQLRNCIIESNAQAGVNSLGAGTDPTVVDARFNWWGDPAGPFGPAGDSVSTHVDYSLHLTSRPAITID